MNVVVETALELGASDGRWQAWTKIGCIQHHRTSRGWESQRGEEAGVFSINDADGIWRYQRREWRAAGTLDPLFGVG